MPIIVTDTSRWYITLAAVGISVAVMFIPRHKDWILNHCFFRFGRRDLFYKVMGDQTISLTIMLRLIVWAVAVMLLIVAWR